MRGVFWFLCGNRETASSRLQGYGIHEALNKMGYCSHILFKPKVSFVSDLPNFTIANAPLDLSDTVSLIQKLKGPNTERMIQWLRRCGSKVIYVNCDLTNSQSWRHADSVFATTEALCRFHREKGGDEVRLVEEPYEYCQPPKKKSSNFNGKITALWFGHSRNWPTLLPWKEVLETEFADRIQLVTCSGHSMAMFNWSAKRQMQLMQEVDFAIIPTASSDYFKVKSPNRLIQSMAVGLPAIVGPLESYRKVISESSCVIEAADGVQFRAAVNQMLDREYRRRMSASSFEYVIERFSPKSVGKHWAEALDLSILDNTSDRSRLDAISKHYHKIFSKETWKSKMRRLMSRNYWRNSCMAGFSIAPFSNTQTVSTIPQ